jgi:BED zinc finger
MSVSLSVSTPSNLTDDHASIPSRKPPKPTEYDAQAWDHGKPAVTKSSVWDHFTIDVRRENSAVAYYWCQCVKCHAIISRGTDGSTGSMTSHMKACKKSTTSVKLGISQEKVLLNLYLFNQ